MTRDPELRYTPQGTAVCTFGLATNRSWVTEAGDQREDTQFHRIVSWNKLAEICSQLLFKGRRVYVEGRLKTREWTGQDGNQRQTTEVVIDDMLILDSKRAPGMETGGTSPGEPAVVGEKPVVAGEAPVVEPVALKAKKDEVKATPPVAKEEKSAPAKAEKPAKEEKAEEEINPGDIPF